MTFGVDRPSPSLWQSGVRTVLRPIDRPNLDRPGHRAIPPDWAVRFPARQAKAARVLGREPREERAIGRKDADPESWHTSFTLVVCVKVSLPSRMRPKASDTTDYRFNITKGRRARERNARFATFTDTSAKPAAASVAANVSGSTTTIVSQR